MQTKNLIQTTTNVIKITNLKKGDVVKMIETSSYSSPEISYAVILDMLNDGDNTFIQILKYKKNYDEVKGEIKLFKGTDEISLFPASIEEVKEHFEWAVKKIEESIDKDKENLQKKIEALGKAKEFVSGEMSKKLTEVEFSEIEQSKFLQLQKEKQERIKQLEEAN